MDANEFLALLEEVMEIEPGTAGMDDNLDDLDWDSLSVLGFISAVDAKLDVTLDAAALADVKTPAELLALVDDAVAG
jgi:acyl carrier protein